MTIRLNGWFALTLGWTVVAMAAGSAAAGGDIAIVDVGGKLRVTMGGELFTEYHYKDVARPYLYPVIGPGGASMTRDWPMKEADNDAHDHVHHKGLWYAHGDINGIDFWSEQKSYGKTIHEKFLETISGSQEGVICARNNWVAPDGTVVCADERTIRFYDRTDVRMLDYEITLIASHGDMKLGDTKEGSMAIRVPATMSVKGKGAQGHIINSAGVRDQEAWGKRADWVDYYGPVNGRVVGIAIFDHPQNTPHPTWWHVRDYGLFAANPFGLHDFEKKPAGTGAMTIAAGKSVTFRYRFLFHNGNEQAGRVAEHYLEYTGPKPTKD